MKAIEIINECKKRTDCKECPAQEACKRFRKELKESEPYELENIGKKEF